MRRRRPITLCGLDITDQAVHAAAVTTTRDGPADLLTHASAQVPDGLIVNGHITDVEAFASMLADIWAGADMPGRTATLTIPAAASATDTLRAAGTDAEDVTWAQVPTGPSGADVAVDVPTSHPAVVDVVTAARYARLKVRATEPAGLSLLRGVTAGRPVANYTDMVVSVDRHCTTVVAAVSGWPSTIRTYPGGTEATLQAAATLLGVTPQAAMRMVSDRDPDTTMRVSAHLHALAARTASHLTDAAAHLAVAPAGQLRLWVSAPVLALPPFATAFAGTVGVTPQPITAAVGEPAAVTGAVGAALCNPKAARP